MIKQKDGIMKQIINSKYLSLLIFLLSIVVAIKIIWMIISIVFLPKAGEEYQETNKAKKLYYRVKLTNESNIIAPVKNTPVRGTQTTSMKGYKLLGLYNSEKTLVVTVEKSRKTTILSKDEEINGFKLVSAASTYAIFTKGGKEFKLSLVNIKNTQPQADSKNDGFSNQSLKSSSNVSEIVEEGGVKLISRDLLTSYTKDIDKIWKDIGIVQNRTNGKLDGFKINFVKRGSDFEKLGLKRGDILKAVNAEELNSLSSAMNFFKDINNIENLTLTVERDGRSEDMEYEIQ